MEKKIVKLNGGLGNQMFQYAFAVALSKNPDIQVLMDFSWIKSEQVSQICTAREFKLDVFGIECKAATEEDLAKVIPKNEYSQFQKLLWSVLKIKKFKPKKNKFTQRNAYKFSKKILTSNDYYYYDGYFQNKNYFKNLRHELLENFSLKEPLDEQNQAVLEKIQATNSVSIHVRRGDYVTLECAKNKHGICPIKYYKKAIKFIEKKVENPHFFIFSDDIDWVSKNLEINAPFTIVDFNQAKGWLDLELMKHCKHNITANSSFSWWGAWLNENPKKIVVAPKKWTAQKQKCEIIPHGWVKL